MDLRKELIERLAAGERLTDLCREFGISRKTGSKYKARFERFGVAGLEDESRAPHVIPHKTPPEIVELIVEERRKHSTWGARKLKDVLETRLQRPLPSHGAIERILANAGLVAPRKRRPRHSPQPTTLRRAERPNDVWCIDFKGQFRLGDGSYCYPLTLTDQYSRFVLGCEAMPKISDEETRAVCVELFDAHGMPDALRSDNGPPFASTGLGGLTKFSALLLRLGIKHERTRPSHPEDNGQHERMHRTLKAETTRPARFNLLQQQQRFDEWVPEFNELRPHEALDMKRPADVYTRSSRVAPSCLPELAYPLHDDVLRVSRHGEIHIPRLGNVRVTSALVGEDVGIREEPDGRLLVTYVDLDLGHIDRMRRSITPTHTEERTI